MPSPLGDELELALLVVDEERVGVAAAADVERLAGADRDHAHLDPGLRSEYRQEVGEQARLLGRGGRGEGDERVLRARGRGEDGGGQRRGEQEATGRHHGPFLAGAGTRRGRIVPCRGRGKPGDR